MEKKAFRWQPLLWFCAAGIWLVMFCWNLCYHETSNLILVIQFLNLCLSLLNGFVYARQYQKENSEV